MKIIHITPFYGEQYGGSERYVSNLVKFQSKKHEVHIYSTTRYYSQRGVSKIGNYYLHRFYSPVTIWNINPVCLMLPKLLKVKADIFHVHSYLYFSSNQAIIAKLINKTPTIIHLHGGVGLPPYKTSFTQKAAKIFYDNFIGKIMLKNVEKVASVSKLDIIRAREVFGGKSVKYAYIPNGVDTKQFTFVERKNKEIMKFLYVGDMEPWKGINKLLDSIENDGSIEKKVVFQFIGQGSLKSRILELAKTLDHRIEYLGEQSHDKIPQFMQAADAFIFPSNWEGTPTVILEAMSTGLPVLTTPVGDIPIIIKHKKNGIIFNYNEVNMSEYINLLVNDVMLRKEISKKAAEFVRNNYDFSKIADLVEFQYNEILLEKTSERI